jgi:hypothetical protein
VGWRGANTDGGGPETRTLDPSLIRPELLRFLDRKPVYNNATTNPRRAVANQSAIPEHAAVSPNALPVSSVESFTSSAGPPTLSLPP